MNKGMMRVVLIGSICTFSACAHTEEQHRQSDFVDRAENRVSEMESNISKLDKRVEQQLPGAPKRELTAAVENLKNETAQAKAELKDLKARDATTWVEKKPAVDRELYEMDGAYNEALRIFSSH